MKKLTCEYEEESGLYWVTTRVNGHYTGGQFRDAEEVKELGFNPDVHDLQNMSI